MVPQSNAILACTQTVQVGCPRVPNEVSGHPELLLNKAEAHSTSHLFIELRVPRGNGGTTGELFHPTHEQAHHLWSWTPSLEVV